MRPLVWYRSDLRIHDHRPLHAARAVADRGLVAVFAMCPSQWRSHDLAAIRVDLVLRTLRVLSEDLAALRIALRIVHADDYAGVPSALLELARAESCDAIHFGTSVEVNERRRDEAVTRAFESDGRAAVMHDDQCLVRPGSVRTKTGGPYTVFTPFRRRVQAGFDEHGAPAPIPAPAAMNDMVGRPDPVPDAIEGFDVPDTAMRDLWPGGEAEATRRLTSFIESRADRYDDARDLAAEDATSRLSPYIAIGAIGIRTCHQAAVDAMAGRTMDEAPGLGTWISELIWRDFYRHVMVAFPRVSMHRAFKLDKDALVWIDDDAAFEAWCEGRTGFPMVDAGMRQLRAEGWMHNRLRMITASFLVKDLLVDWRLGERWFMQHLVDGDLASNNGGWQWSASTGTDAQPWFRIFNPTTQGERFDPDGAYVRRHVPELAGISGKRIHRAVGAPASYPEPLVDHAEARTRALNFFKS